MHRLLPRTRAWALLAAVAVALAAAACSGPGGVDKAGCTRAKPPVVLTLANHQQGPDDVQFWIEEVQRRSGGSLRIEVTNRWWDQEVASDEATIADVRAGRVQLAKVAARAYDNVGVDSFQALVAPLLIDNPTLERRVLESYLAGEMLVGISKLGLVGLAMLAPTCAAAGACCVRWWRSRTTGAPASAFGKARSLRRPSPSAPPLRYRPGGPLRRLDGAELDLSGINWNEYDLQAKVYRPGVSLSRTGGR